MKYSRGQKVILITQWKGEAEEATVISAGKKWVVAKGKKSGQMRFHADTGKHESFSHSIMLPEEYGAHKYEQDCKKALRGRNDLGGPPRRRSAVSLLPQTPKSPRPPPSSPWCIPESPERIPKIRDHIRFLTLTLDMKNLTIKGKSYKVRYYAEAEDRQGYIVVLMTDKLEGTYGDEWPLEKCSGGYRPAGEQGPVVKFS